jgi:hypothetical protein
MFHFFLWASARPSDAAAAPKFGAARVHCLLLVDSGFLATDSEEGPARCGRSRDKIAGRYFTASGVPTGWARLGAMPARGLRRGLRAGEIFLEY